MKKRHFQLTSEDRRYLENLTKSGSLKARQFKRAMALLELDRAKTLDEVSRTLRVSLASLARWRNRYRTDGLAVLDDKARSGRPPVIDGETRAKITALACSEPPEGHGQWSLRLLADKVIELGYCKNISHTYINKLLKKTNLNLT